MGACFAASIGPNAGRLAISETYSSCAMIRGLSADNVFEQSPESWLQMAQDDVSNSPVREVHDHAFVCENYANAVCLVL